MSIIIIVKEKPHDTLVTLESRVGPATGVKVDGAPMVDPLAATLAVKSRVEFATDTNKGSPFDVLTVTAFWMAGREADEEVTRGAPEEATKAAAD